MLLSVLRKTIPKSSGVAVTRTTARLKPTTSPSLYGKGRVNPTQNLVDAFPMANGYPINDVHSAYDPANPYANRDPRLSGTSPTMAQLRV